MMREESHKHYLLKEKFILGDKWMDHRGIIWTIDDITEDYVILEGEVEEKHILKKIDLVDYNDFLNFRLC